MYLRIDDILNALYATSMHALKWLEKLWSKQSKMFAAGNNVWRQLPFSNSVNTEIRSNFVSYRLLVSKVVAGNLAQKEQLCVLKLKIWWKYVWTFMVQKNKPPLKAELMLLVFKLNCFDSKCWIPPSVAGCSQKHLDGITNMSPGYFGIETISRLLIRSILATVLVVKHCKKGWHL